MEWKGIRTNITDVLSDFSVPETQIGTDMRIKGELGRRPGFQSTSIAKQAGPIRYIMSAFPPNRPFLTFDIGGASAGTVIGTEDAPPPPPPHKRRPPIVVGGQPVAPVINSITANPTSPPATYVIGNVTFTPNITYDGLSGALIYSWLDPMTDGGIATAFAADPNVEVPTFDFNAGCTPGNYGGLLSVSTTINGFSANFPFIYTVL